MTPSNDFEAELDELIREISSYGDAKNESHLREAVAKYRPRLQTLINKSVAAIYEECNQKLEIALKAVGGKNAELEAELKNLDERLEQLTKEGEDE